VRNIYVALPPDAVSALVDEAARERRHPKDLAALIITDHLRESGALGGTGETNASLRALDETGQRPEGRLVVYLPPEVAAALRRAATADHRSARQQAVHVIAHAVLNGTAEQ
jgi:hypothetical protein